MGASLSLYFDLDSFTVVEIADLMAFLSELYEGVGGDGLVIDDVVLVEMEDEAH